MFASRRLCEDGPNDEETPSVILRSINHWPAFLVVFPASRLLDHGRKPRAINVRQVPIDICLNQSTLLINISSIHRNDILLHSQKKSIAISQLSCAPWIEQDLFSQ